MKCLVTALDDCYLLKIPVVTFSVCLTYNAFALTQQQPIQVVTFDLIVRFAACLYSSRLKDFNRMIEWGFQHRARSDMEKPT